MQPIYHHEKRSTVPDTLHGTINQTHKLMFHAFINTYESEKDFYITTEDTAFGDFDDAVIITEEGKVTAIQYKHVINPLQAKPISLNNLVTKGGSDKELMLHKYYKSVVDKGQNLNNPLLNFEIAINVNVSEELIPCIDFQTQKFNAAFFSNIDSPTSSIRRIIVASILKYTGKFPSSVSNERSPIVWPRSGITQQDITYADNHPEKEQVIAFLRRLILAHSEINSQETANQIKQKLLNIFKQGKDAADILYHAFFHYFLEWLGSHQVKLITKTEMEALFETWQNRFIYLQRWIGISMAYQSNLVTSINDREIAQTTVINRIKEFEENHNPKRVMVLHGERGLGKSTTVYQFIKNNRCYDSDYIILDLKSILQYLKEMKASFRAFKACKMILLDNCEELLNNSSNTNLLKDALREASSVGIKIILIYRLQNFVLKNFDNLLGFSQSDIDVISMPPLSKELVIKIFPETYALFQPQPITHFKPSESTLLQELVCKPFYLNLFMKYYYKHHRFVVNFSSTDNFIEIVLKSMLDKKQVSFCRKLIFLLSQKQDTKMLSNSPEAKALVMFGIVAIQEQQCWFSHKLFEEWAVRIVIEKRLKSMMKANQSILEIYQELAKQLPSHLNEIYIFLGEHLDLNTYHRKKINSAMRHNGIFNNNTYFFKMLIQQNTKDLILQHRHLLLIQVDMDPIGALNLLLLLAKNDYILELFGTADIYFKNIFFETLVRSLCLCKNLFFTHKLFFQVLEEFDRKSPEEHLLDTYSELIFIDVFCGTNGVGLMGLNAKLTFLQRMFNVDIISMGGCCYSSYIYKGLLKAANPNEYGEARTYDRSCYFSTGDTYVDYKGNCYSLAGDDKNQDIRAYNQAATRILVSYYNHEYSFGLGYQLGDIIEIFESTIQQWNDYNPCEVAIIIAAEINLNDESIREIKGILSEYKDYDVCNTIKEILSWRKKNDNKEFDINQMSIDYHSEEDYYSYSV